MYQLNHEQFDFLLGFKLHIWNHYHSKDHKADFEFWAQKLDGLKIPWFVQNTTAILMETRANGFSCLKNLLKIEGVTVI